MLVFDVLGAGGPPAEVPPPLGEEALIVRNLRDTLAAVERAEACDPAVPASCEPLQEAWNDAIKFKDDALSAFRLGYLGLPERALAERLYWACCRAIAAPPAWAPSPTSPATPTASWRASSTAARRRRSASGSPRARGAARCRG